MLKFFGFPVVAFLIAFWWIAASPRPEIGCCIADSLTFDPATLEATEAGDRSEDFARDLEREESLLGTQTSLFRVTRIHPGGPKAGTEEVVIDSLPGTP
jgi:hypothetical protein